MVYGFLKPDRIVVIERRIMDDVTKSTDEDKRKYNNIISIMEKYHEKYIKVLTKHELLEHSQHE